MIPFFDKLGLSFLKELEEVDNREEETQEVENQVADRVEFGIEVLDSRLKHDESPGQSQG